MTRVFFDMDGVLAEYKFVPYERYLEKDYFLNLKPQEEVVNALVALTADPDIEVCTLSAVVPESEYALEDKKKWLKKYIPGDALNRVSSIFLPCGEDKTKYVPGGIKESDILIDDYNGNLYPWSEKATAIKLLNGINDTHHSWQGIRAEKDSENLTQTVYSVINSVA